MRHLIQLLLIAGLMTTAGNADARYLQPDPLGTIDGPNTYSYARQNPTRYTDPTGECPWCVAGALGAATNLATQLVFNGGNFSCVDWTEVLTSAVLASTGVGIAQKLGKVSFVHGGPTRPTHHFFKSKGRFRAESHPISRKHHDRASYPHFHLDFGSKKLSKKHFPLVEPIVAAAAGLHNAFKDDCGC